MKANEGSRILPPVAVMGADGKAACDRALASDSLQSRYWVRKLSLLRARALHEVVVGDTAAALADLDLAASLAPDPKDRFYQRSLGVGLDLARGYALRVSGQTDQADALIQRAWSQRPYSSSISLAALFASGDLSRSGSSPYGRAVQNLHPRLVSWLFNTSISTQDYDNAIALYGQLTPQNDPVPNDPYEGRKAEMANWARDTRFWSGRTSAYAVALARTGRIDQAREVVKRAGQDYSSAMARAPAAFPDLFFFKMRSEFSATVEAVRTQGKDDIARASAEIDRLAAGGKVPPTPDSARLTQAEIAGALLAALPEPDVTTSLLNVRDGSSRQYVDLGMVNYSGTNTGGSVTIRYRASVGSEVEEMAMQAMAQRAVEAGQKGFVLTYRRDTIYTLIDEANRSNPDGVETTLTAAFVDPANLPPQYAGKDWRAYDARKILVDLSDVYGAPRSR